MRAAPIPALLALLAQGCIVPEPPLDRRDQDRDGYLAYEDCDDLDPDISPGVEERCDGRDEDCDGLVDDAVGPGWYTDADGDGWGTGEPHTDCEDEPGMANRGEDCDDADPAVNPAAGERCDGLDEDCDGLVDEDPTDGLEAWFDHDGDGYGSPALTLWVCALEDGLVDNDGDCQDGDPDTHPGGQEVCDEADDDEDCDGLVDDADADTTGQGTVWRDRDGDGTGDTLSPLAACDAHEGYAEEAGDCDDQDPAIGGPEKHYEDLDGDGYGVEYAVLKVCLGTPGAVLVAGDCAPEDPERSPAAVELWYDGVDQDCDGGSDYDQDGDGYDADAWGGEDCDDLAAAVLPDAVELWYDGVDQDCDGGSDYDQDGDGYDVDTWGGEDCQDLDARANPEQTLPAFPGDWDCDGAADLDGEDWTDDGSAWSSLGAAVAGAGDVDGDGLPDLLIGAPGDYDDQGGGVLLISGPGSAGPTEATATFGSSITSVQGVGWRVGGAGDLDQDGYADVLVGARNLSSMRRYAGSVGLLAGPISGELDTSSLDLVLSGDNTDDHMGDGLDLGDLDGDGSVELALGAPYHLTSMSRPEEGVVYVTGLDLEGDVEDLALATLSTGGSYDRVGAAIAAGDSDGDGIDELLIGAPEQAGDTGRAWLVSGPLSGALAMEDLGVSIAGLNAEDAMGAGLDAGVDVNGDGYEDLLLGAPDRTVEGASSAGSAWLMLGPISASRDASTYDARYRGDTTGERLGSAVVFAGDLDGDGAEDIAVGAPGVDGGGGDMGEVWLYLSAHSGSYEPEDASLALRGGQEGLLLGSALAAPGDLDGDGYPELLAGGGNSIDAGQVLLLRGGL